jgi:hypothetical protein
MSAPGLYLKLVSWNDIFDTEQWTDGTWYCFMKALEPHKTEGATIGRSRDNTVCLLFDHSASRFSCKISKDNVLTLCTREENENKPHKHATKVFSKTQIFTVEEIENGIQLEEGITIYTGGVFLQVNYYDTDDKVREDIARIRALYADLKRSDVYSIEEFWTRMQQKENLYITQKRGLFRESSRRQKTTMNCQQDNPYIVETFELSDHAYISGRAL